MTRDQAIRNLQNHVAKCDVCMASKLPSEYCNAGFSLAIAISEADFQMRLGLVSDEGETLHAY